MKTTAAILRELKENINYIEEQARAPLYHVTTVDRALKIVTDGKIKMHARYIDSDYVSTTRSKHTAHSEFASGYFGPVVFHIDQDSLKQNTKVKPIALWIHKGDYDAAEETVRDDIDLKHVTHISYPKGKEYDRKARYMLQLIVHSRHPHIKVIRHDINNFDWRQRPFKPW